MGRMSRPTHIVTVLTPDRRGIVHALATALADEGIPQLGISQTVVHGAFTIALALEVPPGRDPEAVRDALGRAVGEGASTALLAIGDGAASAAPSPAEDRYLLTAIGPSGAGVVAGLSAAVLEHGGNFTDFSSRVEGEALELVAEVGLPEARDLGALQAALARVADADAGLTVRLQHQRLFAATNEVAFRRIGP